MNRASTPTPRYARRKEEILKVASAQINIHGTRGMTLTAVARELGLDTSSVTYYFKRKDQLAAACLARSFDWQIGVLHQAAAAASPRARVRAFLVLHLDLHRLQREPGASQLALLSDMGTLPDDLREGLEAQYQQVFTGVMGFFEPGDDADARRKALIATTIVLSTVYWMPAWIDQYHERDFERIEEQIFDLLEHGLAAQHPWPTAFDQLEPADGEQAPLTRFLHAATNLINQRGYIGASVERIAAQIGVSTGSFYHHLRNKDDLVVACFDRCFTLIEQARSQAAAAGGSAGARLARMCSSLIALQFTGESPLLQISVFQALPPELRGVMLHRAGQSTRQVAGMISDAMADGSIRVIDAPLASHAIVAAINAAADLRPWAKRRSLEDAVGQFSAALSRGIF